MFPARQSVDHQEIFRLKTVINERAAIIFFVAMFLLMVLKDLVVGKRLGTLMPRAVQSSSIISRSPFHRRQLPGVLCHQQLCSEVDVFPALLHLSSSSWIQVQ